MIQKKKEKNRKEGTKTAFSFNAMANKNHILLTPGNIQTPKSLWYETNSTSRLSHNQILQTYAYIRRRWKGKKQAGIKGEPLVTCTTKV